MLHIRETLRTAVLGVVTATAVAGVVGCDKGTPQDRLPTTRPTGRGASTETRESTRANRLAGISHVGEGVFVVPADYSSFPETLSDFRAVHPNLTIRAASPGPEGGSSDQVMLIVSDRVAHTPYDVAPVKPRSDGRGYQRTREQTIQERLAKVVDVKNGVYVFPAASDFPETLADFLKLHIELDVVSVLQSSPVGRYSESMIVVTKRGDNK